MTTTMMSAKNAAAKYVIRAEYVTNVKTMMVKTMNNTFTIERRLPFLIVNDESKERARQDILREAVSAVLQGYNDNLVYKFTTTEETENYDHVIRLRISVYPVTETVTQLSIKLPAKKNFFKRLCIGIKYIFGMR